MNPKPMQHKNISNRRKRWPVPASSICVFEQISLSDAACSDNLLFNISDSDAYDYARYYFSLIEKVINILRSVYE